MTSPTSGPPPAPAAVPRSPGRLTGRLLTLSMVLAAVAFVSLTLGTSLIGRTAFYGGGVLLNNAPWIVDEFDRVSTDNIYVGDTIDSAIPSRAEAAERLRSGDFPGWTSLQSAGTELASTPSFGLLAPSAWPWWVLPAELAPGWERLTILVVAAAGTALFLRRLGLGRHAAWLAGMIYAGSGFMIAWTNWPQAAVAAMLPWLFWSVERSLQLRTLASAVPVALSVAALLLGGFPAVTGWGLYGAGIYALVRLVQSSADGGRSWTQAIAQLGRLTLGLILGIGLAAVQLAVFILQFLDLDTSYRAGGFFATVPLRMALTSVFPNTWGINGGIFYTATNPVESNTYLGAAAAVLCVVAVVSRPPPRTPRGVRGYFVVVAIFCAFLVYVQAGFTDWISQLPIFSGNPIMRLVSLMLLACSFLAGFGADALLRQHEHPSRRRRIVVVVTVSAFSVALVLLAWFVHEEVTPWLGTPQLGALPIDMWLVVAVAGAFFVAALAIVKQWRPRLAEVFFTLVPFVVAAQALIAAAPVWEQVDADRFYPETPMHDFLAENLGHDRMIATGQTMLTGTPAFYGLRATSGHTFFPQEYSDLINRIAPNGRMSPTYWMLPSGLDLDRWQSPGLDRAATKYLVADANTSLPGELVPLSADGRTAPLSRVPVTLPVQPGPLRGLLLQFVSGPAKPSAGWVAAELLDAHGETLATTRRLVEFPREASALPVPLAAEDFREEGRTLRLSWEGDSSAPVLRSDASGRPAVTLVRPSDDALRLVFDDGGAVWERTTSLPRIRWAGDTIVIRDSEDRADMVAHERLAPYTVVLSAPGERTDRRDADLTVTEDSGDTVAVRADADGAGYLVLADAIQSDWSVTVDGQPAEIVDADHAFGAVHVPAGGHEIVFTYSPRGQTVGSAVSALSLAVLALLAVPPRVWRSLGGRLRRVQA
jgi:hypothetical protein